MIPIIILNWNGYNDTIECMEAVSMLRHVDYRVYLIDNGSSNNEGLKLKNKYAGNDRIEVICNDTNLGFAKANNIAMEHFLTNEDVEFIALLNNDTVVSPDWLYYLKSAAIDQKADMISSKMIDYYNRNLMDNAGHFMLNTGEILPKGHQKAKDLYVTSVENVGACAGAALYRVKMLKEIGLFDSFFNTGYEDAELGVRAKILGYKCIFEPRAVIYHKMSRSIKKIRNDDYYVQIQRNILFTYFKLMTKGYFILNGLWFGAKYMMIAVLAIFLIRFKVLRHHIMAIYRFIKFDIRATRLARKNFYRAHKPLNPYISTFFLPTDIRRLFYFIVGSRT